jgi:uncharacterized protein
VSRLLPLLPLRAVLFPQGVLRVTVTAAPAIELMQRCQREAAVFGVSLMQAQADGSHAPASTGVVARIETLHLQGHALQVTCLGRHRFRLHGVATANAQGQWQGDAFTIADDALLLPEATMFATVQALGRAIAAITANTPMGAGGQSPIREPYRLDDAGWVANRWCELLPIKLEAKQQLMALTDPRARLALVDAFVRAQGIVR